MSPSRPLPALTLSLIVTVSACGDSAVRATPDVTVTDSLGISVRTYRHTDEHLDTWGHDPEPVLQIGALEGDGPEVFGRITSLRIAPDGGVVVSDALAGEIRSFSATGAHLGSLGGSGEGPGEFSNSVSVLRVSGDSVWAWDQRQQRVSVFTDGAFATSWNTPEELVVSRPVLVGSRLFGQSDPRMTGMPETGMNRPSVRFVVVGPDGSYANLFETSGHERVLDIRQAGGQITAVNVFQPPFARGAFFGVVASETDTRIIGGPNDRLVLREWNEDGELRAIHRYPGLDRPVTEARIARERERIRDRYDEPTAAMRREVATLESEVPEYLPAFDRVRSDDDDRLWLRRSAGDGVEEWLVLGLEDLTPMARIVLPAGFTLFDVRDGLLGGQWLDELEASHARLYRLRTGR